MPSEVVVTADGFATVLDGMLQHLDSEIIAGMEPAIKKSCQYGARVERKLAPSRTGEYKKGITYKVSKRSKDEPFGEIGNKRKPGLAHLLEKGHARVGGGTVPARPHISDAAKATFERFEELVDTVVDEALND